MVEVTERVRVDAPAAQVWDALIDWDRQAEWMLGTRVRATAGGGRGVGAEIRAVTGLGPLGVADHMRIVEWRPPHYCGVVHLGRIVRGTASFEVEELPAGGSQTSWTERLDLPFGAVTERVWPLLRPAVAWGLRVSLRRFAAFAPAHAR